MNPPYNVWLTTLEKVQQHQSLASDNPDWDAMQNNLLRAFISRASMQIVSMLNWLPLPHIETRLYDYSSVSRDRKSLWVGSGLLSVTAATNGNGSVLNSSSYVLAPANTYPRQTVRIVSNINFWQPASNGQTEQVISIAGLWGYVPHYGREWQASGATVPAGGMTSSGTTIALTAGQGALFQTGQYLRIDDEFLLITAITGDTLTVARGALGSTADAHSVGALIEIYQQLWDIEQAATEWAAYLYKSKDRIGENVQLFDSRVQVVNGLSPLVREAIYAHRYVGAGVF